MKYSACANFTRFFSTAFVVVLVLLGATGRSAAQTQEIVWQQAATGGTAITFSNDGTMVLAGNQLLNAADGTLIETFRPKRSGTISVALSPDGQYAAIGTSTNVLNMNFFRVADGVRSPIIGTHNNGTSTLKFSDDGQLLASGGRDGTVKLWHVPDLTLLNTFLDTTGYQPRVLSLVFSKDGQYLVVSSQANVQIIRIADGAVVRVLSDQGGVQGLALSPDGNTVAGGYFTFPYALQFWDFNSGAPTNTIEASNQPLTSVAYQPDGQVVAAGGGDDVYSGIIRFFRVSDSQQLGFFPQDPNNLSSYVTSISYSPDGQLIAYARADQLAVVARNPFACHSTLSVNEETFDARGGQGFVDVRSCAGDWSATSDQDWIQVVAGDTRKGDGTVEYWVSPNKGGTRTGNLLIGEQTVTITQQGRYRLAPSPSLLRLRMKSLQRGE